MPAASVVKVVLTHNAAGHTKYGTTHWNGIKRAVRTLISADKQRGLTTRLLEKSACCGRAQLASVALARDAFR